MKWFFFSLGWFFVGLVVYLNYFTQTTKPLNILEDMSFGCLLISAVIYFCEELDECDKCS